MIALQVHSANVQERFRTAADKVVAAVQQSLDLVDAQMQSNIVGEKLSGQLLQHRSGVLASSVRMVRAAVEGGKVRGSVQAGGGPAYYALFQDRGVDHPWQILPRNKKALAFFPQGAEGAGIGSGSVAQSLYGGRRGVNRHIKNTGLANSLGGVVVRGVVHPPLKATEFMEKTAAEFEDVIVSRVRAAIGKALKQ